MDAYWNVVYIKISSWRCGKLKVLAALGAQRSRFVPKVPTAAEQGVPGYEAQTWFGLFAPAGTPGGRIDSLYGAAAAVSRQTAAQSLLLGRGLVAVVESNGPADFAASLARQSEKWGKVIKDADIKLDS